LAALQIGSGLVFAILWRLGSTFWWRLAHASFYYGPRPDAGPGVLPLTITAFWLSFGVLMPLANAALGDRTTSGNVAWWLALSAWPFVVGAIVLLADWPMWLQPPGRWHVVDPELRPARWRWWALPVLLGACVLVSAAIAASQAHWATAAAGAATVLVIALGILVPIRGL
jgi:hypothetical protein